MDRSNRFRGATAIVTGGASGIGRALCEALAKRGATVVVADKDLDRAQETATGIHSSGGTAHAVHVDVSQPSEVEELVKRTVSDYGRLDFMFNNAGIGIGGMVGDFADHHWTRVMDVNFQGVLYGTRSAYAVMRSQGSGSIVNTASVAGLIPLPLTAPYTAAKHAVVGLSLSMRPEAAQYGVHINVVCPGFVQTNIYQAAEMIHADRQMVLDRIPVTPMPAQRAADAILRGVLRNRSVIVCPFLARLAWWLYRVYPDLTGPMARRMIRHFQTAYRRDESPPEG